ncbi:MAG: hypothetical protein C3F07_12460 [Anaerolineales bacterium]|nr:hypothetical protein [Anaerolineae bacterium]PWB72122.1 MAG: hypothetical protein C3F07_12460 [Anaerolineales bacterium]
MAYTKLTPHFTPSARVEEISREPAHYLLTIPSGRADKYRVAQLDDYAQLIRRRFPHRRKQAPSHPLGTTLSLSARTSSNSLPGTWGFGFWNDPFGLSIGYGGKPFRLPALPNAVWFFGASEENYLSFASGLDTPSATRPAANGFLAQSFRAPRFHPLLALAGLALPFSRKLTRRLMSQVIAEDGIALNVDPRQWHRYRLEWREKRVSFEVDEVRVFESAVSPHPPLGLVIWIDNQFAAFTPEGKIGFGVLENPEPAWLEIKDLEVG